MSSERPVPLAYFVTFTCRGTWLHGDSRGSVDRNTSAPGAPVIAGDERRRRLAESKLTDVPVILDAASRECVRSAIEETFSFRGWDLLAINVRSNHVHFVVRAPVPAEDAMRVAKAWATRRLHELRLQFGDVWTRHGSTRYLWTTEDVDAASFYVLHGQGADISGSVPTWREAGPWSRLSDEI